MLEDKHGTSTERAATHKACVWFIIKQQGFGLPVHPHIQKEILVSALLYLPSTKIVSEYDPRFHGVIREAKTA